MMTIFGFDFVLKQRHRFENLIVSYNIAAGELISRSRWQKIFIGMGLDSLHDEEGRANL